jgi:hypothetical protein
MPTLGLAILLVVDETSGRSLLSTLVPNGSKPMELILFKIDTVIFLAFGIPSS